MTLQEIIKELLDILKKVEENLGYQIVNWDKLLLIALNNNNTEECQKINDLIEKNKELYPVVEKANQLVLSLQNRKNKKEIIKNAKEVELDIVAKRINQLRDIIIFLNENISKYDKLFITALEDDKLEEFQKTTGKLQKENEELRASRQKELDDLYRDIGFKDPNKTEIQQSQIKVISIFLASSEELKEHREKFETFIYRENKRYIKRGIFLNLEVWEDFIDCMSPTRLQDEYNEAAISSDIFVSLFWTKVGKYTKEEFNETHNHFKKHNKPLIYTYFSTELVNPQNHNTNSIHTFLEELKELGHNPQEYDNIDNLKHLFKMQLQDIFA